jgi:hypothetical protein
MASALEEESAMKSSRTSHKLFATVCAAVVGLGLALTSGVSAHAVVNDEEPRWKTPQDAATFSGQRVSQIYSIRVPGTSPELVLDVYGGATHDGAPIKLWEKGTDSTLSEPVAQVNQVWEFVPSATNEGRQITTGWGELRGRHSNKCLDIHGGAAASDGAFVTLWSCHGGSNQQWAVEPQPDGTVAIRSRMLTAAGSFYLGRNSPGCGSGTVTKGDALYARTSLSGCTKWAVDKASYAFATNPFEVLGGTTGNEEAYLHQCMAGWKWRHRGETAYGINVAYVSLGDAPVEQVVDLNNEWITDDHMSEDRWEPSGFAQVVYATFYTLPYKRTGQVALICDPL